MKFDNILFPIDFSEQSYAMVPEVEWLANRFNSSVTLLNVFEVPTGWYGGGEAPLMSGEAYMDCLDDNRQRLKDFPIGIPPNRIQRMMQVGSAALQITDWAEHHPTDLIVMGTHGYGPVRRFLLGSVTMKVLHDVECPVWTHPAPVHASTSSKGGISHILCSVEVCNELVDLLRFTRDLAADFSASVRLIHCVPEVDSIPARYFDSKLHESMKTWARQKITKFQDQAGTDFPLLITDQMIVKDIVGLAADQKADLLVIGRGKAQEAFGSVRTHAYEIIRHTPCPVISFSLWQCQGVASASEETAQTEPQPAHH